MRFLKSKRNKDINKEKDIPEEIIQEDTHKQFPFVQTVPRSEHQISRGSRRLNSEDLEYNLAIVKKLLPDPELTVEQFIIGSRSQTKVNIIYLKDLVHKDILDEVLTRLKNIKAEIILDASYIERNIQNSTLSPFPQIEKTERADVTISALNQGRIGILVEGSPNTLLAPTTLFDILDTYDDSYRRWFIATSFFRMARIIMLLLAIFLPGLYIALTSYNPELIPTVLTFNISAARSSSPLPIYLEAFLLMGIIEGARMVMLRLPTFLGQTICLLSGISLLIAGLASNIFNGPIIIIVTLTMIASFGIPDFDIRSSLRLIQFFTMFLATTLGLFGLALAFFFLTIHLVTLKSFGIPYLAPLATMDLSAWGHTIFKEDTKNMPIDKTYKRQSGDKDG